MDHDSDPFRPGHGPEPGPSAARWGRDRDIDVRGPKTPIAGAVWGPEQVRGTGEAEVIRIALAQRGCVTREQLRATGLGRGAIEHRLASGRLHLLHKGVYVVGRPSLEPLAAETTAILYF